MSDNTKKTQCKHCFHFFSKDSNSTLKNHISHPHCEALKRVAKSGQSSMSQDGSIFVYTPDVLREQFAGLVIQRGLPFNQFDDEQTTRVFQNHFQQKYNHILSHIFKQRSLQLLMSWVFGRQRKQCFPLYAAWSWIYCVQATSVASESAFSTSGRVLSIRRTRLTPASLEMCMCLKDHLDAQERKQDKSTLETPIYFKEEILDAEVQENEAIPLSDEEIALDAASSESSMSGPGSGGEEGDYVYDMTNYHDDYCRL
ncbi:zinc finger BED domain-containing protein RICESLEEPER 3 [Tanacetum coccineum]